MAPLKAKDVLKGCVHQGHLSLCVRDILLSLISVYKCQEMSLVRTKQSCSILFLSGSPCPVLCPFTFPQS